MIPAPLDSVSVYVHLPFCASRCRYCDFYVETGSPPAVVERTLEWVLEEATWFLDRMERPRVRTVYIGGGTPSLIPPDRLSRFLDGLAERLGVESPIDEWTIEANPESVTPEFLTALAGTPVDRLSLGIQSFQDQLLRVLGRRARAAAVERSLDAIAAHGRERLTVDLITGTPTQTADELEHDLERLRALAPGHVSLYALTVEPGTPLERSIRTGRLVPLPPEVQDDLWISARDALVSGGYAWYEISNFALPGHRSLHNPVYWRAEPYLGLGPGAVGTIPMLESPGPHGAAEPAGASVTRPVRLTNPDAARYTAARAGEWNHEREVLDDRTLLVEHLMLGLRTDTGVRLDRLEAVFGLVPPDVAGLLDRCPPVRDAVDPDAWNDGRVVLAADARLRLNALMTDLLDPIEAVPLPRQAVWPTGSASSAAST